MPLRRRAATVLAAATALTALTAPAALAAAPPAGLYGSGDPTYDGVRIRVLVEGDLTDAKPVKYASRDSYEALLSEGVAIYEYQPTMMHAKVMVVDGVWSMFGSANFDNRSLELNDELNVAVHDQVLAARFLRDFEEDLTHSHRLTLEDWRRRSPLERLRESFWSFFGEVF